MEGAREGMTENLRKFLQVGLGWRNTIVLHRNISSSKVDSSYSTYHLLLNFFPLERAPEVVFPLAGHACACSALH
jgi:hypothetical protein